MTTINWMDGQNHILHLTVSFSTGNCTDIGCSSQWENHGSCVDFSNTDVDFEHLGATLSEHLHKLERGLRRVFPGYSLRLARHLLFQQSRIGICQFEKFRYAGVQNGTSCWCGNERNATYLVPATLIRCAEQSQK